MTKIMKFIIIIIIIIIIIYFKAQTLPPQTFGSGSVPGNDVYKEVDWQ